MSIASIEAAFKAVLGYHPEIRNRFYFFPKHLQELNASDFEQSFSTGHNQNPIDGPIAAMLPPISFGSPFYNGNGFHRYICIVYFLRTSFNNEIGEVKDPDLSGLSKARLADDWNYMKSIAKSTFHTLDRWFKEGNNESGLPLVNSIHFVPNSEVTYTPISMQGNYAWSGIKAVCQINLNEGCETVNYSDETINQLIKNHTL